MNRIRRIRRLTATLAGLACAWLGLAAAAPAAFASVPRYGDPVGPPAPAVHAVTRTVMVGGMPGWQIALIALGTALLAAALAVLADRVLDRAPQDRPVGRVTEQAVPRFMEFHPDLKLPAEAIAQIADDTRHHRADQFGVRQLELYHNAGGAAYCLLEGPDEQAIRRHHAALGVPCGDVHQVNGLT